MARVILTQPAPRVARIAARLRALGHRVGECPVRRLVAAAAESAPDVDALLLHDWVIFVSPGAVEFGLRRILEPWPPEVGIAVVGPGTAAALTANPRIGPQVRIIQPCRAPYDAAALLERPEFREPGGLRVLVVRGETGRDDWIERLRSLGAEVEIRAVHRSERLSIPGELHETLRGWRLAGLPAVFVFTSVDAVTAVDAALMARGEADWARDQRALAQHHRIAQALSAAGWRRVEPVEPGEEALVRAIESEEPTGADPGACSGQARGRRGVSSSVRTDPEDC